MPVLKNVRKSFIIEDGRPTWLLHDLGGRPVSAFTHFCQRNFGYAFATQKRYAEVVAHFIDYLIEARAFGVSTTKRHINRVVEIYPRLLASGSQEIIRQLSAYSDTGRDVEWMIDAAMALQLQPLARKSFPNTLAAINRFLLLSESLAIESLERAALLGVRHNNEYNTLISSLDGTQAISPYEKQQLRQNASLGFLRRATSGALERPGRLRVRGDVTTWQASNPVFPLASLDHVLSNAGSLRDQVLWLLLAATGIRISEALNLLWRNIDLGKRTIAIVPPTVEVTSNIDLKPGKVRFKGRDCEVTYILPQYKQRLFELLEDYVRHEFVPYFGGTADSNFVFQYVEIARRGFPLINVSSTALNKAFVTAQVQAGVVRRIGNRSRHWPIHSLRHSYGDFLLNDLPLNDGTGKTGLELSEVQLLMGHRNAQSTRQYARKRLQKLWSKLEAADRALDGASRLEVVSPNDQECSLWR